MIKVFLVEDEAVIRNGIKNGINWAQEGLELVGEAADGELAYPMIKETKPDILITDIKMPFMDGLELSASIKNEMPEMKIIILSGYNEFDYAKEAIKIGITEYLLKPTSSAKLLTALKKVAETVTREREDKNLLAYYLREMQENREFEKQKFFQELITEDLSISQVLNRSREFDMDLAAGKYCIILFKVMTPNQATEYSEHAAKAGQAVEALEDGKMIFCFRRGLEGWAFLVKASSDTAMEQLLREYSQKLCEIVSQYDDVEYFGGIGSTASRLREVKQSYYDADRAFAKRFVSGLNQIIFCQDTETKGADEIEFHSIGEMEQNREMIRKFLRSGVSGEVEQFIAAYFGMIQDNNLSSMLLRQYVIIDSYITAMSFIRDLGVPMEEMEQKCGQLKEVSQYVFSLSGTRRYMTTLMEQMILIRDTVSARRGSDMIARAKQYIQEHYMTDSISLNKVAAEVNMSPSYFSTLFRQDAGETFVEYLTEVRMNKARELLMCSRMKTSEIGYEVGYKDAHYFSYIFKKTQGCSPKEYRMRKEV